jgi:hypothetical protein
VREKRICAKSVLNSERGASVAFHDSFTVAGYMLKARLILPAALFVLGLANIAQAHDFRDWDNHDKVLLGTALGATMLDWAQTRYIARHPERYREINPVLGSHPAVSKVDKYFALSIVGITGIALELPSRYRKWWLGGVTVIEVGFVLHNDWIGIKADF